MDRAHGTAYASPMLPRFLIVLAVAASIALPRAASADPVVLKIGTLAPSDSPWGQVFKVWKKSVA